MNWEAAGALGEIIGAIAVFATLAYLATQIRQNTKAVRAAALDSTVNLASIARSKVFEDSELTEIYLNGSNDPKSLSRPELVRYQLLMTNIMWAIWNLYSQSKYAEFPSSVWESQKPVVIRLLNTAGGKWFWDKFRSEFEDSFCEAIETMQANATASDT